MRSNMKLVACAAACLAVLFVSAVASGLSIESEPVKVTHRNSGPRYDIDAVERARQSAASAGGAAQEPAGASQPQPSSAPSRAPAEGASEGATGGEETPVGHIAIRRIFLFPMVRPSGQQWGEQEGGAPQAARGELEAQPSASQREQESSERDPGVPSLFAKPFWPFMTPGRSSPAAGGHHDDHEGPIRVIPFGRPMADDQERPQRPHYHHQHLFGADEASRSPSREGGRDQDPRQNGNGRPLFDPIQVMMDLMHQAISAQMGPTDLNKNKEPNREQGPPQLGGGNDNAPAESSDERPQMPQMGEMPGQPGGAPVPPSMRNETHEDVVEIDGKKYLRKTLITRHVGEGLIFMTRRLIFVPLNETDSATTTETVATTTTEMPATRAPATEEESPAEVPALQPGFNMMGTNRPRQVEPAPPAVGPGEPAAGEPNSSTTTSTTTTSTTSEPPTSASPTVEPIVPEQPTIEPAAAPAAPAAPVEETTSRAEGALVAAEKAVEKAAEKAAERLTKEASGEQTAKPAAVV